MGRTADLQGSTVEMLVLGLLQERAMYGYEVIQVVNERTEGAFAWKEGTLYPVLHRLEARGLIVPEWREGDTGKQRRYYALTKKGLVEAQERVQEWQGFTKSVNAVLCRPAVA
jgi:PadR family transcriptional regulator, regulatory protein PadR